MFDRRIRLPILKLPARTVEHRLQNIVLVV